MRRAARIDDNQPQIVADLRACGVSVQPLHAVGGGVPDLLVGWRGRNVLIEIKDGSKPPSRRRLTPDQEEWHASWRGQVAVAENIEQALEIIGFGVDGLESVPIKGVIT